jgi:hypothetical protein
MAAVDGAARVHATRPSRHWLGSPCRRTAAAAAGLGARRHDHDTRQQHGAGGTIRHQRQLHARRSDSVCQQRRTDRRLCAERRQLRHGRPVVELQDTTYTLSGPENWWYGPNGLPEITSAMTINGHGALITRSAAMGTSQFRLSGEARPHKACPTRTPFAPSAPRLAAREGRSSRARPPGRAAAGADARRCAIRRWLRPLPACRSRRWRRRRRHPRGRGR